MSVERVRDYLKNFNLDSKIMEFSVSSATVADAANAVGTEPAKIAKSLSFLVENAPIIIVCAGDTKIDNSKFKQVFHVKSKMIDFDNVEELTGHRVGSVCPFAIKENVKVYFDESLKRFDVLYPAAGSSSSAVELTIQEFEKCAQNFQGYIDVCKQII